MDDLRKQESPEILQLRKECLGRGVAGIKSIGRWEAISQQLNTDLRYCFNFYRIFSRMFRIFDDDGNKNLNEYEFLKGMRDYGTSLTQNQLKDIFSQFDRDGSGSISFDELLNALRVTTQTCRPFQEI